MRIIRYIYALLLGAGCYAAYRTWLAHLLFYHGSHSVFRYGAAFREEFVAQHGWTAYVDSWLTAMMASPAIGAAIMALLLVATLLLADAAIRLTFRRPDVAALAVAGTLILFISSADINAAPTPLWLIPCVLAIYDISMAIINKLIKRGGVKEFAILRGKGGWVWLVAAIVWTAITFWYIPRKAINRSERIMLLTEAAARDGRDDEVVERADNYLTGNRSNKLMLFLRSLALARKGELPDRLLDRPQRYGTEGLAFPWRGDSRESDYGSMVYELTGHINEAHHWESEALVVWGPTPRRLEAIARYEIAMGRPAVARKYIRLLAQTPFGKSRAAELEALAENPNANVRELRYSLADEDKSRWVNVINLGAELRPIVAADPSNTIARDYLLCFLLLRNDVSEFVEEFNRHSWTGTVPRIYREALLLASLRDNSEPSPLVDEATRKRFERYAELAEKGSKGALASQMGNTYWYYVNYLSPYGNKVR